MLRVCYLLPPRPTQAPRRASTTRGPHPPPPFRSAERGLPKSTFLTIMDLPKNAFFIPLMTVLILGSSAERASADITWNLFYQDVINSTGVGFDDAILGGTRQTTFEATLDYVNSVLDEPGTVDLNIASSQMDASEFLASAGPLLFTAPNGFANGFVFDHATFHDLEEAMTPSASPESRASGSIPWPPERCAGQSEKYSPPKPRRPCPRPRHSPCAPESPLPRSR
jgi:hypothetical protein